MTVLPGEKYRHFKGGEYEIIGIARNYDNPGQHVVVYRALCGEMEMWVRLLEEFEGDKVFDDGRRVKRFEKIGDMDSAAQ